MVILQEQKPQSPDQGTAQVPRKGTLDQFWRLGQAKNEKNRLEAATRILQAVTKSELEVVYTVTRLVKGLAGSSKESRKVYFVCLTELMRQAGWSTMQSLSRSWQISKRGAL